MTREQALSELHGTWIFKETDGMIALREVALIEAVHAHQVEHALQQSEPVTPTPASHAWPTL